MRRYTSDDQSATLPRQTLIIIIIFSSIFNSIATRSNISGAITIIRRESRSSRIVIIRTITHITIISTSLRSMVRSNITIRIGMNCSFVSSFERWAELMRLVRRSGGF